MAKKPAPANEPKPEQGQTAGTLEQAAERYDAAIAPAAFRDPAPEFSPDAAIHALAAQVLELAVRMNALAAHHLQTYGKVI